MAQKKEKLSMWKVVVAGGTAGVSELGIMYPTDVIKTRMQVATTKESFGSIFRTIMRTQGVRGFYRGIASPVLAEAPKRAWKFAANEEFKGLILSTKDNDELTLAEFATSGALAGVSEALVNCPFETVKVRMQSKEFVSKFKGSVECLLYLLKNEGVTSVYRGLEAQMWRNGVWNAAYFGVIGSVEIRKQAGDPKPRTKREILAEKFVCGSSGSMLGTLLNTPLDVAKSRLQLQNTLAGETAKYRWTFQTLAVIHREEGFAALYKGLGVRLLRLAPGGGILVVVVDFVSDLLRDI